MFEIVQRDLARFHRAARDEDHGNIDAQRGHKHAGRDFVAVRDADHRVSAMGVDHIFDAVRNQLAGRERIKHAVMAHRDPVIDRNRIKFLGDTARFFDFARDQLTQILQMDVAGNELGEGIDHRDNRLPEILVFHACGAPKAAGTGHIAAMSGRTGAICGHFRVPELN